MIASFKNWSRLALPALLAAAFFLRLPGLGDSLWMDEITASHVFLKNVPYLLSRFLFDSPMPVHYTFMFFWIRLFGDSEISLRIPPLLFGLLSIALATKITEKAADRKTALLAAFLLSVSPVHIWYSAEARPYSLTLFLLLFSLFSFFKMAGPEKAGLWRLAHFACVLLAAFSHLYMISLPFLFAFLALCPLSSLKAKRPALIFYSLTILLFLLFLYFKNSIAPMPSGRFYYRSFTLAEAWLLFFNWFTSGNSVWRINPAWTTGQKIHFLLLNPLALAVQLFFCALLIRGVLQTFTEKSREKLLIKGSVLLFMLAVPSLLFLLTLAGFKNTYVARSAIFSLPFFLALTADGAFSFKRRWARAFCAGFLVLFSLLAVSSFFWNKAHYQWTVVHPKTDWRSAARFLEREIGREGTGFVIFSDLNSLPLCYYESRLVHEAYEENIELKRQRLAKRFPWMAEPRLKGTTEGEGNRVPIRPYRFFNEFRKTGTGNFCVVQAAGMDWGRVSERFLHNVSKDPGIIYLGRKSFPGVILYKFRLKE